MAFIRTIKQENPFSQIDRYVFESDDTLSWKAKGLMGYLLTRPDDWKINHKDLVNRAKDGKDAVTSTLQELEKKGYIHYYQERGQNGKFGEWIYDVYERPMFNPAWQPEKPDAEKPDAVKPDAGKPDAEKPDYSNNKRTNNKRTDNKLNNNNQSIPQDLLELVEGIKPDWIEGFFKVYDLYFDLISVQAFKRIVMRLKRLKNIDDIEAYLMTCCDNELNPKPRKEKELVRNETKENAFAYQNEETPENEASESYEQLQAKWAEWKMKTEAAK